MSQPRRFRYVPALSPLYGTALTAPQVGVLRPCPRVGGNSHLFQNGPASSINESPAAVGCATSASDSYVDGTGIGGTHNQIQERQHEVDGHKHANVVLA